MVIAPSKMSIALNIVWNTYDRGQGRALRMEESEKNLYLSEKTLRYFESYIGPRINRFTITFLWTTHQSISRKIIRIEQHTL